MSFIRFVLRSGKGGFALGFLVTLTLIFAWNYLSFRAATRSVSETKASGLASLRLDQPSWSPESMWKRPRILRALMPKYDRVPISSREIADDQYASTPKKIVRKAQIQMTASSPLEAMNHIRDLADKYNGIVSSAVSRDASEPYAQADIVINVPAEQLDAVLPQIRRLATQLSSDQVEATDVTKQFVDEQATIKNLEAQEEQYRRILKNAAKVEDVMSVTEKLDEVRDQIDKAKAEFKLLEHDIALSSITVSIKRDSTAARFYNWRPVRQVRESAADLVEGMAGVFNSVIAMVFYLPILIVWLVLVVLGSVITVRVGKVIWRRVRPLYS